MTTHELHRETEAVRLLLATFADVVGDDEIAKADMIEGETNLNEAMERVAERLSDLETLCDSLKAREDKLAARRRRLEEQQKNHRTAMLTAMEVAGVKRLELAIATVSRKPIAASAVVTNEADVPAEFWRRGEPKLDKKALLTALKAAHDEGRTIPGAQLSNGGETVQLSFN